MKWLKVFVLWCALIGAAFTAVGCNTLEGVGEDVEAGGEGIQDAADGDE